jgi:radical SAM superfamily enzyme YgiQ (UPF0313 family)
MPFVFITPREYHLSLQQLIAILKQASIPCEVVFSKFSAIELLYLQYVSSTGNDKDKTRAQRCLQKDKQEILDQVAALSPTVVGFSVGTDFYQTWLDFAREIKQRLPKVPVVMGGTHPTTVPERVIAQPWVDAVAVGEADTNIVALYKYFARQSRDPHIPGIWFKTPDGVVKNHLPSLVEDLDKLPFPELEPFLRVDPNLAKSYQIMTARGCPFNCTYCHADLARKLYKGLGKYVRKRSNDNVLEELRQAKQKYPLSQIRFVDDVFTLSYKWLDAFLPGYQAEIGLPFTCSIHPNTGSQETLKLLAKAGCASVKMGIQHVNPRICDDILNRHQSMDRIRRAAAQVKELGMHLVVDFIIGVPTETEDDLKSVISLVKELHADDIFLFFLKYYPGTQILNYASQNGFLTPQQVEEVIEGLEFGMQMIPARIQGEQRAFYDRYNGLIREAAGSKFRIERFDYLLDNC